MTMLIASGFAATVAELEALATAARRAGADAVEARIDAYSEAPSKLTHLLREHDNLTWVITCRGQDDGGRFAGNGVESARRALDVVNNTDAWIDVALTAWRSDSGLRKRVRAHLDMHPAAKLILSVHDFEGTPTGWADLVEEALREGSQIVPKVAYSCPHVADSFQAMDLMHRFGPRVVAIGMGEAGAWTRLLAKKLGAFATFASLPETDLTAPGQRTVRDLRDGAGWDRMDAGTRIFGVVGDPVVHSLSPRLFNHWFGRHHCNAVFLPLRVGSDRGGLARFLAGCEQRPWLHLSGLSVTIPHKIAALNFAGNAADPMSRAIGAANTLVLGETRRTAYNTDCYAAVDSLAHALGRTRNDLNGLTVDVLGAGGSARAVCFGLSEMGCRVRVFARSDRDAKEFSRWGVTLSDWTLREQGSGEVLVNCTPIGMWPNIGESPIPAMTLHDRQLVFDLIYRPLKTKLLADAEAAGCRTLSGLDMFVRQAATQFALWTGISPDTAGAHAMLEDFLRQESNARRSIALIGARGCGKTTVGAMLAKLLNLPHVDTDEVVTAASGQTIAEIFSAGGEAGFRHREADAIGSVVTLTPAVISVGGGAVLDARNVEAIRRIASVVWLTAPASELARRVAEDSATAEQRPRLTPLDALSELEEIVRARTPLYRTAADFIVDTSQVDAVEVARRIADWFGP